MYRWLVFTIQGTFLSQTVLGFLAAAKGKPDDTSRLSKLLGFIAVSTGFAEPHNMGVSKNRGSKYSTLNSRILIRTPKIRYPPFRKLPHGSGV